MKEPDFHALVDRAPPAALVVTAGTGEPRAGCLVTFHCQASIDPLRYMVALSPNNHTTAVASDSRHVAVHWLAAGQRSIAELFGGRCSIQDHTFRRVGWRPWDDGTPLLEEAAGWFVGAIVDRWPMGDHVGFLLDVVDGSPEGEFAALNASDLGPLPAGHAP